MRIQILLMYLIHDPIGHRQTKYAGFNESDERQSLLTCLWGLMGHSVAQKWHLISVHVAGDDFSHELFKKKRATNLGSTLKISIS